jgi:alpha-tubulin suppressor-like RCC1 family protein
MRLGWLLVVCVGGSAGLSAGLPANAAAGGSPSRADIVQLALGAAHSCALHSDGAVSCWGRNRQLQLGIPDPGDRSVPVAARPASGAIQIAAAFDRTCVLDRAGAVSCWGARGSSSSAVPVALALPPVAQIRDSCLRMRDGSVACWTLDGTLEAIAGVADARDVAAWGVRGCAVVGDGKVACWGYADLRHRFSGHLAAATPVDGVTGAVQVAAGEQFACAVLRDRRVSCWGVAHDGQLGRGRVPPRPKPSMWWRPPAMLPPGPVVGIDDAIAVVAGSDQACALRAGGAVACWGKDPSAAVATPIAVARPVAGLSGVTALATSGVAFDREVWHGHSCALRGGRDLVCWGSGAAGQLGNGWSRSRTSPIDVPGLGDAVALSTTSMTTHCALRRTGRLACWGLPIESHHIGFDQAWALHAKHAGRVVDVAGLPPITDAAGAPVDARGTVWSLAPDRHLLARKRVPPATTASSRCAVARGGQLWCWRQHDLFDPHAREPRSQPVPAVRDAVAVHDSADRTCALRRTGAITCLFGYYDDGLDVHRPFDVPGVTDASQLALGASFGSSLDCAIRADRSVWCWRWPAPSTRSSGAPPFVAPALAPFAAGVTDAVAVDVGSDAACAVRGDGLVLCWGSNDLGQLGDGTTIHRATPTAVRELGDATGIALGDKHACALRRTGQVACWGDTMGGAAGTFATGWIERPVAVAWP